jgi:membrane-bound lytic murein transglycosylase D
MKLLKSFVMVIAAVFCSVAFDNACLAQTQPYQQMRAADRANFVSARAKEIARRISDSEYQFTASFETEIQTALDSYVQRLKNGGNGGQRLTSPRVIIERGQTHAPTIMSSFKARGVSPLIGLYLPWIESEYVNEPATNSSRAIGMFQFMPGTGKRLGLTEEELLDVEKSADAAARYIAHSMKAFEGDKMKEAIAILAYNRGDGNVQNDVARLVNEKNNGCSICALTEQQAKPKKLLNVENTQYVPRFFAAAILGENPQAFGLTSPPLSSFGTGH